MHWLMIIHKSQQKIWKRNSPILSFSPSFTKNTSHKNWSNFTNSWRILEIPFVLIFHHPLLHLFWKFESRRATIRNCPRKLHQWWIWFSRIRSNFDWIWASHSTPGRSFCNCFWLSHANTSRFITVIKRR